jgi:hypothetical protein
MKRIVQVRIVFGEDKNGQKRFYLEEPFRSRLSDSFGYQILKLCHISVPRHSMSHDTGKRGSVSGVSSPTEMMTHQADADTASSLCRASVINRHQGEL